MKTPFPFYGGKAPVASEVWARLGDVPNFVEPFFGSGAVLLARPHQWWDRIETVNDADGMISNFWRATRADPDAVARWADWPVEENSLHARHAWLVERKDSLQTKLEGDPDYYDAKIAGWWLWGICIWIGSGWCSGVGPWHQEDGELVRRTNDGTGTWRQLPHLGNAGRGISRRRPDVDGKGINRQLPRLNNGDGLCGTWSDHLRDMMRQLSDRLRRVRVCCGDWSRICGPTPTFIQGLTGVFLDPPYSHEERDSGLYDVEMETAGSVREWAMAQGENPLMRIALCGYEGEHEMPETWHVYAWKTQGGYGNQGNGRGLKNASRETIWFSPHCLTPESTRQGVLL